MQASIGRDVQLAVSLSHFFKRDMLLVLLSSQLQEITLFPAPYHPRLDDGRLLPCVSTAHDHDESHPGHGLTSFPKMCLRQADHRGE